MERVQIKDIKAGKKVTVAGFVDKIRDQKSIQFIILRDTTGKVQVTVFKPERPEIAKIFEGMMVDSVVAVTGKAVDAPNVKLGGIEIVPDSVEVLSVAKLSPIDENTGPDIAMDYRWIELRDTKKLEWFKTQTQAEHYMREFLISNNFIEAHTPKISDSGTEGGAEVFEVNYYGRKAYLTQSPQLYKQMAMAAGFERFFEIGANYRAEKSYTSRHATEFFAIDFEMSYINNHHDVMDMQEKMLQYVFKKLGSPIAKKFPRVSLLESYDLLKKEKNYEVPRASKGDLDPEGERLLCEIAREKFNSDFIFITDYPAAARAFYSMRHDDDKNLTKSFDLLYKGVEISSGAQREHNIEKLIENIKAKGMDPKSLKSYTQFFEYGCPPHGGCAIGLARLFAKYFDAPSVKDVVYLFRGPDRLAP
ncbi:MAG: aspartate--tRNA(Asn) ligase [Christensenellaceae bacterium]|jgi:aspartyl-tRNA synthetase|nr:aspartate--tRNA(Asn) ligase [Christensenellaceae bacterium]